MTRIYPAGWERGLPFLTDRHAQPIKKPDTLSGNHPFTPKQFPEKESPLRAKTNSITHSGGLARVNLLLLISANLGWVLIVMFAEIRFRALSTTYDLAGYCLTLYQPRQVAHHLQPGVLPGTFKDHLACQRFQPNLHPGVQRFQHPPAHIHPARPTQKAAFHPSGAQGQTVGLIPKHPLHLAIRDLQRFDLRASVGGEAVQAAIQPEADDEPAESAFHPGDDRH